MAACRPLYLAILLVTLLVVSTMPGAPAAETETLSTKLPLGLVGSAAVYHDGGTYLFGGRQADETYSQAIYRYDHATGTLEKKRDMPRITGAQDGGRQAGTAAVLDGKIYHFGGAGLVNAGDVNGDGKDNYLPRALRDIVEYDPVANTARTLPLTSGLPVGLWGMSSASIGGKVYLFGGFSFDYTNPASIERKDTILRFERGMTDMRVTTLSAKLPYPLQDSAATVIGQRVYVFGGLSDHNAETNACPTYTAGGTVRQPETCLTNKILSFVPLTESRPNEVGTMPYRGQFLDGATLNGVAYIAGAMLADRTPVGTLVAFDPTATPNVRVLVPTLPEPLFGAAVTSDNTHLYVFGGRTGSSSMLTDAIVRFDPSPTPPWAPRALVATPTQTGIDLAWEPPTYDGGSPVSLYRIYRSADGLEETLLSEVVGGGLTFHDDAVKPGVAYVYRVTAVTTAGESETGARATPSVRETAPGAVSQFAADAGNGQILLVWSAPENTGGVALSGYRVYRDGQLLRSVAPSVTQLVDRDVVNGVAYAYSVRAVNAYGEGAASPTLSRQAHNGPEAPMNLRLAPATDGARLEWDAPLSDVTHYVVLRGLSRTALEVLQNTTAQTFTDATAEIGRTYHYAVRAANGLGESLPSDVRIISLVNTPSPPQGLIASPEPAYVRLTWQPPADTGGARVEDIRYQIIRDDRIIATDVVGTTFRDGPFATQPTHAYQVRALNPLQSEASDVKSATPKVFVHEPPVPALSSLPNFAEVGDVVTLDASRSSDPQGRIASYRFSFGDGSDPVTVPHASVEHTYAHNGSYTAEVVLIDASGAESEAATARIVIGQIVDTGSGDGTTLPAGPGGQQAASRPGSDSPASPIPGLGLIALLGTAALVATLGRRR